MFETQHLMQQGWRVIIVVAHVGAVKIYVATMEALRKKERRGGQNRTKLSLALKKNGAFPSFTPPLKAKVPFLQGFFFNLTRFWTKFRVLVPCFS